MLRPYISPKSILIALLMGSMHPTVATSQGTYYKEDKFYKIFYNGKGISAMGGNCTLHEDCTIQTLINTKKIKSNSDFTFSDDADTKIEEKDFYTPIKHLVNTHHTHGTLINPSKVRYGTVITPSGAKQFSDLLRHERLLPLQTLIHPPIITVPPKPTIILPPSTPQTTLPQTIQKITRSKQ